MHENVILERKFKYIFKVPQKQNTNVMYFKMKMRYKYYPWVQVRF